MSAFDGVQWHPNVINGKDAEKVFFELFEDIGPPPLLGGEPWGGFVRNTGTGRFCLVSTCGGVATMARYQTTEEMMAAAEELSRHLCGGVCEHRHIAWDEGERATP